MTRHPLLHAAPALGFGTARWTPAADAPISEAFSAGLRAFDLCPANNRLATVYAFAERLAREPLAGETTLFLHLGLNLSGEPGVFEAGPGTLDPPRLEERARLYAEIFSGRSRPKERLLLLDQPERAIGAYASLGDFYAALSGALETLEALCAEGVADGYGLSSAGLGELPESPRFLSLEALADGPARPRFRMLQAPVNLYELGALRAGAHGGLTAVEWARRHGLAFSAIRPLTVWSSEGELRLRSYRDFHRIDTETLLLRSFAAAEAAAGDAAAPNRRYAAFLHQLRPQLAKLADVEHWRVYDRTRLESRAAEWGLTEAQRESLALLRATIDVHFEKRAAERSERLRVRLVEAVPGLRGAATLAEAALRIYRALPELGTVAVGLEEPAYVAEARRAWDAPALAREDAERALDAAQDFFEEYFSALVSPPPERQPAPDERPRSHL